ncbi:riboflavin biosynthesis protein RibF [Jeotgalicoccus sp. ATCC 8456]|uniref:riboflavin biosynthesis protein RibF n=1 Tax=Jeotgalicoccus sp. ATCC 8456 TaxID=946435 RepID=UPI0018E662D5|nr:riboflavin biosynthesis protein RibF [Jeotgalicoccus sp. ATCC 8456]QQD85710.1 riboflavin biosynthesis protein RibF [Jeotgalicoccus sp. ATCC 8456]
MEIFRLHYPNEQDLSSIEPSAAAIGFFDGLHRGHLDVINTMKGIAEEKGLKKTVITFDPHPSVVLDPTRQRTTYLTPIDVKIKKLEALDIDYLFIINFSSAFAGLDKDFFIQEYIINTQVKEVISGFDYTYGKKGSGTVEDLKQYTEFNTTVVDKLDFDGEKVSTTKIREYLETKALAKANQALGRAYDIEGIVVQGEKRGRTIGFPTANIEPNYRYFMPANGSYAVTVTIDNDDNVYKGVASVGVKPTFHDNARLTTEVYLFDFNKDIYGENVTIHWHHFVRDEEKFDGIEPLIEAIDSDAKIARELLSDI